MRPEMVQLSVHILHIIRCTTRNTVHYILFTVYSCYPVGVIFASCTLPEDVVCSCIMAYTFPLYTGEAGRTNINELRTTCKHIQVSYSIVVYRTYRIEM